MEEVAGSIPARSTIFNHLRQQLISEVPVAVPLVESQFQIKQTNIDQFISANKVTLSAPALADMKLAQRLFRLSPHAAAVDTLKSAGHNSAQSVYFMGRAPFLAQMTTPLGSASLAKMAYARAQMTYATALTTFARYNQAFNDAGVAALSPTNASSAVLEGMPDLQALFGSLDYFQCEDRQSVYSPAAYLVDLLQYLKGFAASGTGVASALDALLLRRPDIQYVALDCNNTNITLWSTHSSNGPIWLGGYCRTSAGGTLVE
jgi:hypothetical protein